MPRAGWLALTVAIGLVSPVRAQPQAPLSPLGPDPGPLRTTPITPARNDDLPSILGAPVTVEDMTPAPVRPAPAPVRPAPAVAPAGFVNGSDGQTQRAAAFGAPSAADGNDIVPAAPVVPVPASVVDGAITRTAPPPAFSTGDEIFKQHAELSNPPDTSWPPKPDSTTSKFQDDFSKRLADVFGTNNGNLFRSDHNFDGFISPVTNPFLFEDPRSLTEVRPIVIIQKVPGSEADFHGGNIVFFGTQARLALTDEWSLVLNKFGGESINTNYPSPYHDEVGFAEIWLGPKWTFYRGEETGTLAAAGLQFQIPAGSKDVFQDTGTLSLVPYASFGQNFARDFSLGSFNFLANGGFSFSVNKERSDYLWLSTHLDLDVNNLHRFYPLIELNWFLNTSNGTANQIGAAGNDLINFGGQPRGSGLVTIAFGGRVKITESAQFGGAFEVPLMGQRGLFDYRFTLDFIFRY
jgi:hypothetical protein